MSGDPCRRLGESQATSNFLDDSAVLVGCPSEASAEALGGKVVGNIGGVRIVSIPQADANAGLATASGGSMATQLPEAPGDAKVPGTNYHATAQVPCGFGGAAPDSNCPAGVIRDRREGETTVVEVTRPDGRKRALFFRGTTPFGADSAQADGSAGWEFKASRKGDQVTIRFGPETYVIVDAFVEGG